MCHVNETLEHSLQTLQCLADELLEVSRSSHYDDTVRFKSNGIPATLPLSDQHKFAHDKGNKSSVNEQSSLNTSNIEEKLNSHNFKEVTINHEHNDPNCKAIPNHFQLSKRDNEQQKNQKNSREIISDVPEVNNESTKVGSHRLFCQHQSPMTNLKKLLERKNHNISSEQAVEIAEKLFCLEGLDKQEIVRHLLKK